MIILGPPGIGKTFVANAVLYEDRVIKRFGTRRHWARLGEVTSLESFRDVLYESLVSKAPIKADKSFDTTCDQDNVSPYSHPASSTKDRLTTVMANLRKLALPSLLVLNDFEHAWDCWRSEVKDILQDLSSIPQLTVLITMRGATELPQVGWRLVVTPLSPWDAKLLFVTLYPNSDRQLDTLLQKVHYIPQIVTFVAHVCQANQIKPSELLRRWNRAEAGLSQPQDENLDNFSTPIGSWVDSATKQVSSEARTLLSVLSMLPNGALHSDLHQYLGPSAGDIHEITRTLTNISLVSVYRGTQLRLLPPIRSHFLKYHELDEASRRNLYSHYFVLAKTGLSRPGDEGFTKVVEDLVREQHNMEAILEDALDRGCIIAVEATLQYSAPRCAIQPRMDIVDKALKLAQQTSPKSLLTCRCLQRLGDMYIAAGSFLNGAALLKQAIGPFVELDEPIAAAECKIGVAESIWINNQEEGIAHLECIQQEFIQLQDVPGQARCFLRLGEMYLSAGRKEEGLSTIESARSKFSELSDRHGAALCEQALAGIYLSENRLDDARAALAALDTLRGLGDRSAVAKGQRLLASRLLREGREEDARSAMRKALEEFEWLGHSLDAAFCMWRLAAIADDDEAIELSQKAIPIFWSCRFVFGGAECRLDLGLRYMAMGRYHDALLHLEIARPELRANGTDWLATFSLAAIIVCLRRDGQIAHAKLAMESHRDELLAAARTPTEASRASPWQLGIAPADQLMHDIASKDQLLFIMFMFRRHTTLVVVDEPPNSDIQSKS
jgi:tetratricopeptide (TPR) repeat protein